MSLIIPKSHPRYMSLKIRHKLVSGVKKGVVRFEGLIAQGRGEAFDYLLGEKTTEFAKDAEYAASALLLLSKNPIISVNGNVAVLVPEEISKLAKILNCPIEINLFYRTIKREKLIEKIFSNLDIKIDIKRKKEKKLPFIESNRAFVSQRFFDADTVLVPLEDGDRAEALRKMGKNVISIDLNPLSRTSQTATISIVDNIIRAVPNLISFTEEMKDYKSEDLMKIFRKFDNRKNLIKTINLMKKRI